VIGRKSRDRQVKDLVTRVFAEWSHIVHPGKWQDLCAGLFLEGCPNGYKEHVEYLGGRVSDDGTTGYDTYVRIEAARKVW